MTRHLLLLGCLFLSDWISFSSLAPAQEQIIVIPDPNILVQKGNVLLSGVDQDCSRASIDFVSHERIYSEPKLLTVTHAATLWDKNSCAKDSINQIRHWAEKLGVPELQLAENFATGWYATDNCPAANFQVSGLGEFDSKKVIIHANHVIAVGGFFERCQATTLIHVLKSWALQSKDTDLKITHYGPGIYAFGLRSGVVNLETQCNSFSRADRKLRYKNVVLGIIHSLESSHDPKVMAFLKRFSIDVMIDGKKVKRIIDNGRKAPTLTFDLDLNESESHLRELLGETRPD